MFVYSFDPEWQSIKYVSKHLTGSVERIPKMHIWPWITVLWCNSPSDHAAQSSRLPLQGHCSISRRTALIPACPFLKMAFPFSMVKRSCQSALWLQMRTPFLGEVPCGNIYWKFKCQRTLCDKSFMYAQMYSRIREPDSRERPTLLGGRSGWSNRISDWSCLWGHREELVPRSK